MAPRKRVDSSSDDELPLNRISNKIHNGPGVINKSYLCRQSYETCNFCDLKFLNKYDHIIHNASHIVIPLISENLYKCNFCSNHFFTKEDLNSHVLLKHTINNHNLSVKNIELTIQNLINKEVLVSIRDDITTELINKMKKDEFEDGNYDIDNLLFNEDAKLLEDAKHVEDAKLLEDSKDDIEEVISIIDSDNEIDVETIDTIKNRLIFEDYLDDLKLLNSDCILNDLTVDCKVAMDSTLKPWLSGQVTSKKMQDKLVKCNFTESVHYSELILPNISSCNQCSKQFDNRYELIIHETKHMGVKKKINHLCSLCDRFIAGNFYTMRRHLEMKHPNIKPKKCTVSLCKICGLKYINYDSHENNYHSLYRCRQCSFKSLNEDLYDQHVEKYNMLEKCQKCSFKGTLHSVLVHDNEEHAEIVERISERRLCKICYMFFKGRLGCRPLSITAYSKVGKMNICEKCDSSVFEIKIVKVKHKYTAKKIERNSSKTKTNVDRLKNIRKKLKKLKLLNKN